MSGGTDGDGTVFELAKGSSTITTLASFNNTNGANPEAGLIEDSSGDLFGTTYDGGTDDYGTVFELAQGSSTITTLASFNGTNGANPEVGLIEDSNGNLFGTTTEVQTDGNGTVFGVLAKGSNTITTLVSFDGTNGKEPTGSLIEDSSGNLFGTTSGGGSGGGGTLFELVPNIGVHPAFTTLVQTFTAGAASTSDCPAQEPIRRFDRCQRLR